jgi:hypothetical protein
MQIGGQPFPALRLNRYRSELSAVLIGKKIEATKMALLERVSYLSVSDFFVIKMNGDVSSLSEDRQKDGRQKDPESIGPERFTSRLPAL